MKQKSTIKNIQATHEHIIKVPYCRLQHLLSRCEPRYYTVGRYGWNADIYSFGSIAICTGYRPFGDITPTSELIEAFDEAAKTVLFSAKIECIEFALDYWCNEFTRRCMPNG